jgi:hypothetical protein
MEFLEVTDTPTTRPQQGLFLQAQPTVVCLMWTAAAVATRLMMKPKPDFNPPQCQRPTHQTVRARVMAESHLTFPLHIVR